MRIDNGGKPIRPHVPAEQTKPTRKAGGGVTGGGTADSLTSVNIGSLDNLLKSVAGSGEIRESVVNDIKLKIQTGEYLAKQSALETASSILNL